MKKLILFFVLALLSSCAKEVENPTLACTQPNLTVNKTVEKVYELSGTTAKQYLYDDVIEAYVVSSDEGGNFFKTISLQTKATENIPAIGFSASIDATNTYIDYRVGNKVYVKLKNQFTDLYYGGLRIGSLYVSNTGDPTIGRISQNEYRNVLSASCTTINESLLVKSLSVEEALSDAKLNTLIELNDVEFTEAALGRHYFEESNNVGGSTNWYLRDKTGNQVIFRTSAYAKFADHFVPEGSGKARGILTKFGSDYQFMVRYESDIVMNGKRNTPFFLKIFSRLKTTSILHFRAGATL
ncbi:DUF5689 domain-containing protein [Flavobacterium sp.]|uniref:DUF5689 domain-containing protein n=1 Tax=Flavobacterium sp. TaxID=239 RepID=UPI0025C09C05|nr:DUF5689 domain-containing protein [Flavobacterium sp.]